MIKKEKSPVDNYVHAICVDSPFYGLPVVFSEVTSKVFRENTVFPKESIKVGQISTFLNSDPKLAENAINQIWGIKNEDSSDKKYWRIFFSEKINKDALNKIIHKGVCEKETGAINAPKDLKKESKEKIGGKIGYVNFWPEEQPLSRDSNISVVYLYDHWGPEGFYFRKLLGTNVFHRFWEKGYFNEKASFSLLEIVSKGVFGNDDMFFAPCPEGEELCEFEIKGVFNSQIMFLSEREGKMKRELKMQKKEVEDIKIKAKEVDSKIKKIKKIAKEMGINLENTQ